MASHPTFAASVLESGDIDPARPTMVLIHALGTGAWMWRPQLPLLGQHYHTLAPDLPGFGAASGDGPFSMKLAAQTVLDLVRTRGGTGKSHIIGLSMGALVALQVYQSAPESVSSLVLSGGRSRPSPALMSVQRLVVSLLPERSVSGSMLQEVRRLDPALAAEAAAHPAPRRSVLQAMQAVAACDFRPLLPRISTPTLVLCGARDRPNLPAARLMGAAIPQARLEIIPEVGHIWNLERPELFARTVLDFTRRVDARFAGNRVL